MTDHRLPIDQHSTVCGYGCKSKIGKRLWAELDWTRWYVDRLDSILSLHVARKDRDDGKVYQVRAPIRYKGQRVEYVSLACDGTRLYWVVRVSERS